MLICALAPNQARQYTQQRGRWGGCGVCPRQLRAHCLSARGCARELVLRIAQSTARVHGRSPSASAAMHDSACAHVCRRQWLALVVVTVGSIVAQLGHVDKCEPQKVSAPPRPRLPRVSASEPSAQSVTHEHRTSRQVHAHAASTLGERVCLGRRVHKPSPPPPCAAPMPRTFW